LKSPVGGMWKDKNIITLISPSFKDLLTIKHKLSVDYLMLYFSGHGTAEDGRTGIMLNQNEVVDIIALPVFAKRQVFIFDACRYDPDYLNEVCIHYPSDNSIVDYKVKCIYESYLKNCLEGITYCFSCSYGGSSWSNDHVGAYFTSSLLTESISWSLSRQLSEVLSINKVCELSCEKIRLCYDHDQEPAISFLNNGVAFPFAVNLYALTQL